MANDPDRDAPAATRGGGDDLEIAGVRIRPGETRDVELAVTQSYQGADVTLPVRVVRAVAPGSTVFVAGAVHGDEVNGTGVVRALILEEPIELRAGTLLLVPVVNVLGFERQSRYLPDRRDLNRCFPGRPDGSLASRFAHAVFESIVRRCDYGIDFHTAAVRRTNYPNVRADLRRPEIRRIALAFGCEIVVSKRAGAGTLRRAAGEAGCATIVVEAGEVWKIEPGVVELGVRGVRNVLVELGMMEGTREEPPFQARIDKTTWLRADAGGILRFHVAPGEPVGAGQAVATISDLLGTAPSVLRSGHDGLILGMTTLPTVKPGDPVCHLAVPRKGALKAIRRAIESLPAESLHERLRDDLASSLTVSDVRAPRPEDER